MMYSIGSTGTDTGNIDCIGEYCVYIFKHKSLQKTHKSLSVVTTQIPNAGIHLALALIFMLFNVILYFPV